MPFVRRDAEGQITAVFGAPEEGALEEIPANSSELLTFLGSGAVPESQRWVESDMQLARVIEDLVDVLIDKNIISFTDLPLAAQQKLMTRHGKRHDLGYIAKLFPTDDSGNEMVDIL